MPQLKLTGLKSGTPIGFMAALGTLRHARQIIDLGKVRLSWTPHGGQWCAVLDTEHTLESASLGPFLLERLKTMGSRREFQWSAAVKTVSRDDFRDAALHAISEASPDDHELADWFASFGSDLVLKNEKIESTPLDMSVARQQFLADAAWLTVSLSTPDKKAGDKLNLVSFTEALFGPWKYEENQHSLGWDPSKVLMGAFTHEAPTAMKKAGVRAAVWLAMESLPFFPCVFENISRSVLRTRGFATGGRQQNLLWPIWAEPISEMAIRTLLSQVPTAPVEEWLSRGVAAVYSSTVYKPNKYLTSFQPGVLLG